MHEYEDWNRNNAPVTDPRRRCDHAGCGQTRAEHTGLLPLEREVPVRQDRRRPPIFDEEGVIAILFAVCSVAFAVLTCLGLIPMR